LRANPHADEKSIGAAFARIGIRHLIWIDGDRSEPITTGHPDGVLSFTPGGKLIVEEPGDGAGVRGRRRDIAALQRAVNDGHAKCLILAPRPPKASPCAAMTYMNLYCTRGAVLTARCGDALSDERAEDLLRKPLSRAGNPHAFGRYDRLGRRGHTMSDAAGSDLRPVLSVQRAWR